MDAVEILIQVLVGLVALGIIGHMVYVMFICKKLPTTYTVEQFQQQRIEQSKPEHSSESEEKEANDLLCAIYEGWAVVGTDEEGNELKAPLNSKQVKNATTLLKMAADIAPTNDYLINEINETANVINVANAREFNGSKRMIAIALIVGILFGLIGSEWNIFIMLLVSCIIYIFASMTPAFILHKRMVKGKTAKSSFMSSILGGVFGAVAAAKTYKTVTKYTDGSKETEYDNSETWITLAFAVFVSLVVSFFMWAIAFINYLRNYVLYV